MTGDMMRRYRKSVLGLTKEQLASALGLPLSCIIDNEQRGGERVNYEVAKKIRNIELQGPSHE